jgi:hypothetical protein
MEIIDIIASLLSARESLATLATLNVTARNVRRITSPTLYTMVIGTYDVRSDVVVPSVRRDTPYYRYVICPSHQSDHS